MTCSGQTSQSSHNSLDAAVIGADVWNLCLYVMACSREREWRLYLSDN